MGPFDLYSDVDGYAVPFETGILASEFVAPGYITTPPVGTDYVRVQSNGVTCKTFIELKNICQPTTTTTTSSSTSTSTTTSTTTIPPTTTTTTTCDCSLNGLSAVFVTPPTTTTTTSSNPSVDPGGISSQTNPSASDCFLLIDTICYIQHQSLGTISVNDRIFNNVGATSPFNGNGNYYKIRLNTNSTEYSARVDSNGYILSPISICF